MELGMVLVLLVAIPVVIFPAAFVWHLNIGGIVEAVREARAKKVATAEAIN